VILEKKVTQVIWAREAPREIKEIKVIPDLLELVLQEKIILISLFLELKKVIFI